MDWTLPLNASVHGVEIDRLFWIIFWITGIAFVIVEAGVVWFLIRYRQRSGRRAQYTHGNVRAEVVWTAVPAVTVVLLGVYSGHLWTRIRGERSFPSDALTLAVTAKQFEWNVTYPGSDRDIDTSEDNFTVRNQFHIPVGEPVVVRLASEDVLHSFFIPQLRVKQDAVPGMVIPIWFQATQTGAFQIGCAELCGLGHYRMRASVTIHDADSYQRWYEENSGAAASAAE